MRRDGVVTEAVGELEADLLYELAGVDEDERAAVLLGQRGQLVVDFGPHRDGGDGGEFGGWDFDGEIEGAALAYLDDGGGWAGFLQG